MHTSNEKLIQLRQHAREVLEYQTSRGMSDAKLCQEIAHLGSTKTYKRILNDADPLDQLDVDNQLRNYEAAVETIRVRKLKDKLAEPVYETFFNVASVRNALSRAMDEDGLQRFVLVQGESATGKDAAISAVQNKWPKITVAVNANPFWTHSFEVPTSTIFNALNIVRRRPEDEGGGPIPMPRYPAQRTQVMFEELRKRKLILIINEGHHCGVQMLDWIKTCINDTPTIVAFFCVPSLLRQIHKEHFAQTQQLFLNRLSEGVYLPSPPAKEISHLLTKRGAQFESSAVLNDAILELENEAPALGNWTYIKLVAREMVIASRKGPLGEEEVKEARKAVRNRRIPRQLQGRAA